MYSFLQIMKKGDQIDQRQAAIDLENPEPRSREYRPVDHALPAAPKQHRHIENKLAEIGQRQKENYHSLLTRLREYIRSEYHDATQYCDRRIHSAKKRN